MSLRSARRDPMNDETAQMKPNTTEQWVASTPYCRDRGLAFGSFLLVARLYLRDVYSDAAPPLRMAQRVPIPMKHRRLAGTKLSAPIKRWIDVCKGGQWPWRMGTADIAGFAQGNRCCHRPNIRYAGCLQPAHLKLLAEPRPQF